MKNTTLNTIFFVLYFIIVGCYIAFVAYLVGSERANRVHCESRGGEYVSDRCFKPNSDM